MWKKILQCFCAFVQLNCLAQEGLMKMIENDSANKQTTIYATSTFKATRVINGQTVETLPKDILQFMISHRFGTINTGAYNLFGLDAATIRLGFDYGISKKLTMGLGRSSLEKTFDGNLKYKLFRQSSGGLTMPVTVTLFSSVALNSFKDTILEKDYDKRLSYTFQALIARKFNSNLSLQLSPTVIHRNFINFPETDNNVFALGLSGRHKITKRLSVNAEYFYILPGKTADNYYNSLSAGIDIETGGHVFQLHITNSQGMIEKFFIPQNQGSWTKGDIYFGFNVSRIFSFKKKEIKN